MSTSEGYHEYIGGISMMNVGGYHDYIGGCSIHRRDIMIHVGEQHQMIKSFQFLLKTPMY